MATETKELILDTAERLFAEGGVDSVSLRSITQEARVNLAAIHYHFGSKEALVTEVFARRVGQVNQERLALLGESEAGAGSGPLVVEDVLRALIAPPVRLSQVSPRGQMFMQLCSRIYTESSSYIDDVFEDLFRELIERFSAAFQRALPEVPPKEMFWRAHFSVGALVHTMRETEKIKRISGGLCDPSDGEALIERMVHFTAAGMRAPVLDYERAAEKARHAAEVAS